MGCGELHEDDAGKDQRRRGKPEGRRRLAEDEDAEGEGADGADAGPYRVGRAERDAPDAERGERLQQGRR